MKLQLALDSSNSQEAKRILEKVRDPRGYCRGRHTSAHERRVKVVTEIKSAYPQL